MEENLTQKEEEGKKNYELAFLAASEEAVRDVRRLLGQHKIDIVSEGNLKRMNFAYKINRLDQGYFQAISVSAVPSEAKLLERDLKTTASVLRFLIIGLPKEKVLAAAGTAPAVRRFAAKKPQARVSPTAARQPKTLSNEALEKKIEEILQ